MSLCGLDEHPGFGLLQTDADVNAVGLRVHAVDLRQVAVHEGGVGGLPLPGQACGDGRGEPGRRAEELLKCVYEVTGGQAV